MKSFYECGCLPDDASCRVLIADIDTQFVSSVFRVFREYKIDASHASSLDEAMALIGELSPEIIILGQRLGRVDTLIRLLELRRMTGAPIVMLTENRVETDRIVALELGADDVLVKPISGRELVARIRARLRRDCLLKPSPAAPGRWRVAMNERRVYRPSGQSCGLTATEFEMFRLLYERAGEPVGRNEISLHILRREYREDDRSIDTLIFMIRKKLGRASGAACIEAIRKQGYRFMGFPDPE